ncbi:MAG: class I SAM-dependent methyltransferase [Caldilinea sp. CFX5]|nr:class I SAM-dependent methyltransferase [Caldilinea sp. CFX5]
MNRSRQPTSRWRWRARLVADLPGDVLEIGVGAGANLPYYRQAARIWAIEPDAERAQNARTVAATCSIPITIDVAGAERLPYPDDAFDHVVSSLVFCSVVDQAVALQEIRRVLKPGGTLHMVEHVRPATRWLATFFSALTPWWRRIAHNCHLDRPTIDVLQREGWQVQIHRRRAMFIRMSAKV